MSSSTLTGSCACGAVRFEADPPSKFLAHCWCRNCSRAHGAVFVSWIGFPDDRFRLVAGEQRLRHWHTETDATRSFCGTCGTSLLFRSPRWAGEVHVAAANLDCEPDRPAGAHVYADRAPAWCPVPEGLPRLGGEDGVSPIDSSRLSCRCGPAAR